MTSLGIKLRSQRERLGLTVSEVAIQIKIRESYLIAIENDHLDMIPGGFFSRSFARQYALALGLKPGEIDSDLDAVTARPEETIPVDRILSDYHPTQNGRGELLPGEEEPSFQYQADFLKDRGTGKRWIAFALLLIAGSVGYLWMQRQPQMIADVLANVGFHSQEIEWPPLPSPAAPKVEVPVIEVSTDAAIPPSESVDPMPQRATPEAEPAPPPTPVEVAVVATEKTWVRLTADGNRLFGGLLEAGERRTLSGANSAIVFTGNAGGVEIVYNGKPLGAVGPRGLVRTAVFTPLGYEIRKSDLVKPAAIQPYAVSAQP